MTAAAGGPLWGAASDDLNATLLEWPAGKGPAEHVNVVARPDGVRYLTAHIRRRGLAIKRL